MKTLARPIIFYKEEQALAIEQLGLSWMDPLISYLDENELPEKKNEVRRVKHKALRYWLSLTKEFYR